MHAKLSWTHYRLIVSLEDNPPIGIILSTDKSGTLVRYTLPEDNKQVFASKYMLYLPKEEELKEEMDKQIKLLEEHEDEGN